MGTARGSTQARTLRGDIATIAVAAAVPYVLWHQTVEAIASGFSWRLDYLVTGWAPWVLMSLGLLCYLPVLAHRALADRRRFHSAEPNAWYGWGVSLYLLGFVLATQVAQLAGGGGG